MTDVQFNILNQTGIITLNRPHALNALNFSMITAIRMQLLEWMHDDTIALVIIESQHKKAFCSGGDLRSLYHAIKAHDFNLMEQLFRQEYALNYLIRSYPKPYIAFLDGIVMGGGIGISVHGSFRIVGDHVNAAMPETNLGFFPDVSASLFLNECPGHLGLYIGLTGIHMDVANTLYSHLGTHYVPSDQHASLKEKLISSAQKDKETLLAFIQEFQRPMPIASSFQSHQEEIDHLFQGGTLQDILSNLAGSKSDFAHHTLATLEKRSPTSLKITFELLRRGKEMTSSEAARLDFSLSQQCITLPDFIEGIRATIIDKDKSPHWSPSDVSQIGDSFIDSLFQPPVIPLELDQISQ